MEGDVQAIRGIGMPGYRIGVDDVELSPALGSVPGWIGPSDMMIAGWLCSSKAASVPTGGLSQANNRDRSGEFRCAQMFAQRVIGYLAPDQRVAHFARAIADAVGGGDRVFRLHQAQLELARAGCPFDP